MVLMIVEAVDTLYGLRAASLSSNWWGCSLVLYIEDASLATSSGPVLSGASW